MAASHRGAKRALDVVGAGLGLICLAPLLLLGATLAAYSTRGHPFFRQERIGRQGQPMRVLKFRTMRSNEGSSVTVGGDPRVTRIGRLLRGSKLDELPQLFNVLGGTMSLVGPRPDVAGFADLLEGDDRAVLEVLPGITGPASLLFRHEEALLRSYPDPELFNRAVLYPAKVALNREYVRDHCLKHDLEILLRTFLPLRLQPKLRSQLLEVTADMRAQYLRLEAPADVSET